MDPTVNAVLAGTIANNLASTGANPLTDWLNHFALTHPWLLLVVPTYLTVLKIVTAIRDISDKTPDTDDNWFEKTVTFMKSLGGVLVLGKRPNAPAGTVPVPGEVKDAAGVKVQ